MGQVLPFQVKLYVVIMTEKICLFEYHQVLSMPDASIAIHELPSTTYVYILEIDRVLSDTGGT